MAARVRHVLLGTLVAGVIGMGVVWATARPRLEHWLRATVIATLERELDSGVELQAIRITLGPVTRIAGGPLVIRHRRRLDVAPLVRLERFETTITWREMFRRPRRVDAVTLTGLAIAIPPSPGPGQPRFGDMRVESTSTEARRPAAQAPGRTPAVIIGRVTADAATLVILPRETRKLPRRFVMHRLTVRDISSDRAMAFETQLENPQPRGLVITSGTFGPWQVSAPARTPIAATYRFVDADLSTIRGLAGVLQAEGRYTGVLERIEATGTSTTPGFDLRVGGRPLPLETRYTVVVDGTNGNTYIQPAEARLGAGTPIRVTGGIVRAEDRRGRTVDLATHITDGRLEDVLALVVDGPPAMRGRLGVDAALLIPPGPVPVVRRMTLDGRFTLRDATFSSRAVQARLDELSRRAQGRPDAEEVTRVVSAFSGRFTMADGVIRFPALRFEVDGARVALAGHYTLEGQRLQFDGRIRLQAGVSRMLGGRKGWLLRPFDGLFRRDGATEFPLRIRGSVQHPEFGVDVKETLERALLPGR
jgi:hypothetical protein